MTGLTIGTCTGLTLQCLNFFLNFVLVLPIFIHVQPVFNLADEKDCREEFCDDDCYSEARMLQQSNIKTV